MDTVSNLSSLSKGLNLTTTAGRKLLVTRALRLTANTTIAPDSYELELLTQYVLGNLSIEEVLVKLEQQETATDTSTHYKAPSEAGGAF